MKNVPISKGDYCWMPACHDAYPGLDVIASKNLKECAPFSEKKFEGYLTQRYSHRKLFFGSYKKAKELGWGPNGVLFDLHAEEKKHLKYIMFNASDVPKKEEGVKHRLRNVYAKHFKIFQDSGGYQLISGAKAFVDPHAVAAAHNRYAHEGVGLDIPTGNLTNLELIEEAAHVQVWNNKILRKDMNKDVDLFMTSHGASAEGRKRYLDITLDSDYQGITIAGLRPILGVYKPTLEQIVLHLIYVILKTKDRATRYHALGVSTFSSMMLLAAVAEYFQVTITSDSARHILAGAGGTTLSSPNLKVFASGAGSRRFGGSVSQEFSFLKNFCTCQLCADLKIDAMYSHSRFLQTHAFNSLCRASTEANAQKEFLLKYPESTLFGLSQSFARAISLLKTVDNPKDALALLRKLDKAPSRDMATSLFPVSGFEDTKVPTAVLEKRIRGVIDSYKKYHKKT